MLIRMIFSQMYGYHPEKISKKQILEIERHWDESCSLWNIPTTIARWIFWDRKAGYADILELCI